MKQDSERAKRLRAVGLYTMIPTLMFVTPLVGWAIGRFIQTRFDTGQWVVVLFSCLGVVAAVREVIRVIKKASEEDV